MAQAIIVAVGVAADGRREVLGFDVGDSENEDFWMTFLRSLKTRGLDGVKLATQSGLVANAVPRYSQKLTECHTESRKNEQEKVGNRMSTPLEDAVLASYLANLREKGLSEGLVTGVGLAFMAERLPSADVIAELIKQHSGDTLA